MLYSGFQVTDVHDCFVICYSMKTQQSMGEHFDEWSDVSVAVGLDADFDGGGISFPAWGGWSTREVPVGHAVLFPGKVSHLHRADPITRGVRHSMTWWLTQ
jgi:predicted 2-oxoglutarate/Fe(II)-dependent dioxygenase YbiX